VCHQVKWEKVTLMQQEQHRISVECKKNPLPKFWQYINKHTASRTSVGDQKLCCPDANEYLAETDTDKASTFLQSIQLN